MAISSSEFGTSARLRQHTGFVAAVVAVVAFAIGVYGAYRFVDKPRPARILLRQATEPVQMSSYDEVPGAGGVLVLLRNDGTLPIDVIDAAFARTSAAPPLYIAPELVPPGGEVNVYVAVPGKCYTRSNVIIFRQSQDVSPVRISVSVQEMGGPIQFVPVDVTGTLAAILDQCGLAGQGG